MVIDKIIILIMSLVITDFVQVYSVFSELGDYFNIGAFIAIMLLSLLKTMRRVYIEGNILLALFLLLGLAINVYPDSSLGLIKSLAIVSAVTLLVFNRYLFSDKVNVDFFVSAIVYLSFLKLMVFLATVNMGFFNLLSNPSETRFSYSAFFNPIYLARSCGLGLIALLFMNKSIAVKLFIFSFFILGLYISGSRGPVLAIMIAVLLYVIQRKDVSVTFKIFVQFILASIVLFALGTNFIVRNNDGVGEAFEDRFLLISQAYELFLQNVIAGSGLGAFSSVSYLGHPHNLVLELMSETGLLGVAIFIGVVIKGVKKIDTNFFWFSLMYLLVNSMFSGSISNNIGLILFSVFTIRYQAQRRELA